MSEPPKRGRGRPRKRERTPRTTSFAPSRSISRNSDKRSLSPTLEEVAMADLENERPIRTYSCPTVVNQPFCIVLPPCGVNFEIKSSTLQILPKFNGLSQERPYTHVKMFEEVCGTLQLGGLISEGLKMRLFPFSLQDRAREWLHRLPPASIRSWQQLQEEFLNAFFPPHRTSSMRDDILRFIQFDGET